MFGLVPFNKRHNSIIGKSDIMDFNSFMDDFFKDTFFTTGFDSFNSLKADVRETEGQYLIEVEIPGAKKEDIKLDVKDDILTVSFEHSEEKNDEKTNYLMRERKYGSYQRAFKVENIKQDEIIASYTDGILKLTLPKKDIENSNSKRIEIQ